MAFEINGIECEPLWEGFQEGCDENGPTAVIPYLVEWERRWDLVRAIRGSSSTIGTSSPWTRSNPMAYPDPRMGSNIYARNVEIRPEGNVIIGSDPFDATHAIVTVSFGMLNYTVDFNNDPFFFNSLSQDAEENESLQYASQSVTFGAEWINIPNSSIKFADDTKIDTPMSRRISVHHMEIVYHRFPLMPMPRLRDYADSLNDATFLGCPRGTVMFEGPRITREQETDGTPTQRIAMNWKWRPIDWNKFLKPNGSTWETVKHTDGSDIYPYKNHRALLLL